jgi:hypothetical protein
MWRRRAATWMPPNVYDPTVNTAAFRCTSLPSTRRSRWSSAPTRCLSRARGWTVAAAHCCPAQDLGGGPLPLGQVPQCPANQDQPGIRSDAVRCRRSEIGRDFPSPPFFSRSNMRRGPIANRTDPKGDDQRGAGKRPRRVTCAIGGGFLAPFLCAVHQFLSDSEMRRSASFRFDSPPAAATTRRHPARLKC